MKFLETKGGFFLPSAAWVAAAPGCTVGPGIDKNKNSQKNPARSFLDPDFDGESEFQRVRSSKYHLGYDMSVKRPKNTILGRNYNF